MLGVGPGRMNGAVDVTDPASRRLFVCLMDDRTLYRYGEASGPTSFQLTGSVMVVLDAEVRNSYGFRTVYFSESMDQVFVGNVQVDPDTLTVEGTAPDVHRFVAEEGTTPYAQRKISFSTSSLELLYTVDGPTLTTLAEDDLTETVGMDVKVHFDFERGGMAHTTPVLSEVHLRDFP